MGRRQLILLALILALGALVRGSYLRELRAAPDFRAPRLDATYHDYWARGLAFGEWTPPGDEADPEIRRLPYFRPPGYPYFLALVYKLTGGGWGAARVAQFALGLANVLLGFWFVRRWYGPAAALVASGLAATYWVFVYYEGEFLEPVLLVTLTWGVFIALGEWRARPRLGPALAAGCLVGAFALVRPNILLFVPVAAGWMLAAGRGAGAARRAGILGFCCAAALVVLPATARNWLVARDLVLISSNGGVNLLLGQDKEAITNHASDNTGHWNCFDYPRLMAEVSAAAGRPLQASEISSRYAREAVRGMLADPGRTLGLLGYKALLFWGPREVSNNKVEELERRSSRTLRALPVSFSLLAGAALVGFLLDRRRARPEEEAPAGPPGRAAVSLLLGAFVLTYFLSFLPYIAAGQYRVPVLPALTAFAGVAVARIGLLLRRGRAREGASWGLAALAAWGLLSVNVTGYEVNPVMWHLSRATAAADSGDAALAEREYRAAIALSPAWDNLHFGLGLLYARGQRLAEAAAEFRRAVELNPAHVKATYNLGLAIAWQGRAAESIPHFERAVALKPDYAEARWQLAMLYAAVGQPQKAAEQNAILDRLRGGPGAR